MKLLIVLVGTLACLGMASLASAKELSAFEVEYVEITGPGMQSVRIDDRVLNFAVPEEFPAKAFRAAEVRSRGGKFDEWLKKNGEYKKYCFAMWWNLGFGVAFWNYEFGSINFETHLYVKGSVAERANPIAPSDRGDFSKPEELEANLQRYTESLRPRTSPLREVIINGRKWYRYYLFGGELYPNNVREYFVTGLASDRYLEVKIDYSFNPTLYPDEDKRPWWMKKAFKYKEQVLSSLKISKPEGSKGPDLYQTSSSPD